MSSTIPLGLYLYLYIYISTSIFTSSEDVYSAILEAPLNSLGFCQASPVAGRRAPGRGGCAREAEQGCGA